MYNHFFSNQDYEFEILDHNLGYFQKKSIIKNKINDSFDKLFFIENNKILSVNKQEDTEIFLPYEKAKFFYDLFKIEITQKYVLINENDEYYYCYIDGFPCAFKDNFEEAKYTLEEYSDGDDIYFYALGNVSGDYIKTISLNDVKSFLNYSDSYSQKFVMEESDNYGDFEKKSAFTELFFVWYKQQEEEDKKAIRYSFIYVSIGLFFLTLSFVINRF